MDNEILRLEGVSKNFGNLKILDSIDLTVKKGDSLSIVGPSGSGKSTLLHISGLMEPPSEGNLFFEGNSLSSINDDHRSKIRLDKIGFLFQFHHLLPDFDVLENVLIPARIAREDVSPYISKAKDLLENLGLKDRLNHRPYQLSGGEQQRTAFARSIIRDPYLLLCDEPTGNLDHRSGQNVMKTITTEIENRKIASIVVTHNEDIAHQSKHQYSLDEGKLTKRIKEAV